jgi:hypothetical protein
LFVCLFVCLYVCLFVCLLGFVRWRSDRPLRYDFAVALRMRCSACTAARLRTKALTASTAARLHRRRTTAARMARRLRFRWARLAPVALQCIRRANCGVSRSTPEYLRALPSARAAVLPSTSEPSRPPAPQYSRVLHCDRARRAAASALCCIHVACGSAV